MPASAAPIGIIANPASGKDIRRLVAHASVFDNGEKRNIVRRVVLGAHASGARLAACEFLYLPDSHGLVADAVSDLPVEARCRPLAVRSDDSAGDTVRAAAALREAGCAVVVTLGGDGTNRAAALGWRDIPLVPISTGTNNVFPSMIEGTVAGAAAGLIATGFAGPDTLERLSHMSKRIAVQIEGESDDLALIDAVLVDAAFAGARAIWDAEALRFAMLARAEPAAVGVSAVGGLLAPVGAEDDGGLAIAFGSDDAGSCTLHAPVAPGLYRDVPIRSVRRLSLGEAIEVRGPGMLAFDGERERRLRPGQRAVLRILRDGPRVIDVRATLAEAARCGYYRAGSASTPGQPLQLTSQRSRSQA